MPGSSTKGKLAISDWYHALPRHSRVLDVGPGWGTYAKLLKEPGEIWEAVEVHEPYVQRFGLRKIYERVYVEDIRTFKPESRYDVIFLGDILEHLSKNDASLVLNKLFRVTKYCVISIPLDDETGAATDNFEDYWNNPYERHLASWSNKTVQAIISKLGGELIAQEKYREIGAYLVSCENELSYLNERKPAPIKNIHYRFSNALDYDPRRLSFFSLMILRVSGRTLGFLSKLVPKKLKPMLRRMLNIK